MCFCFCFPYLFCIECPEMTESVNICPYTKFWEAWPLFIQVFICSIFSFLASGTPSICILETMGQQWAGTICPSWDLFVCLFVFQPVFSPVTRISHFYWSVFNFTDSCYLHCTVQSTQWGFNFRYLLFGSRICIWFFFYSFYILLRFSVAVVFSFIFSMFPITTIAT